jgi:hypothetical protein
VRSAAIGGTASTALTPRSFDHDGGVAGTTRRTSSAHSTERNPYPCKFIPTDVGNIYDDGEAELLFRMLFDHNSLVLSYFEKFDEEVRKASEFLTKLPPASESPERSSNYRSCISCFL